jgi:hypothetical protein
MPQDILSDRVVAVASVIIGVACLAMACGAFMGWRSRLRNRPQKQFAETTQQIRFLPDRPQPSEAPIRTQVEHRPV